MKASPRKRDANRRNALASTGPKTDEGKDLIRFNAVRHGLTARAVLIPGENPAELDAFAADVRQALTPSGALEELLADRVVSLAWRLRRAAQVDAGLFARALFAVDAQRQVREKARRRATWEVEWKALLDEQGELDAKPDADWTDTDNRRWEKNRARVDELMAERTRNGWEICHSSKEAGLLREGRAELGPPPPEEEGSAALAGAFTAGEGAGAVLFERLARYEGTLSREMFRALHELERLQARRGAGAGAVILDVDFSVSGGEA